MGILWSFTFVGDGMNTQAPVFQPKSGLVAGSQHGDGGISETQGGQGGAGGGMVPVVQGETVYYLPEDEEGYEEDLGGKLGCGLGMDGGVDG